MNENIFNNIKHFDKYGNEYYEARELMEVLEYKEWRNFNNIINKAIAYAKKSKINLRKHFFKTVKVVQIGTSSRRILNYHLSRYACYLIIKNSNLHIDISLYGEYYFKKNETR